MIKDELYQAYANTPIGQLSPENIKKLVTLFLDLAALNLGTTTDKANLERVIDIVMDDYKMLPVSQIASAFMQGSMGKLGGTRLIPRDINIWLNELRQEYLRKEESRMSYDLTSDVDLKKYPFGKAILKKITWYKAGLMPIEEWDSIDLKLLAEYIAEHGDVTYEQFKSYMS